MTLTKNQFCDILNRLYKKFVKQSEFLDNVEKSFGGTAFESMAEFDLTEECIDLLALATGDTEGQIMDFIFEDFFNFYCYGKGTGRQKITDLSQLERLGKYSAEDLWDDLNGGEEDVWDETVC